MKKLTAVYIIGGGDEQYENLSRSIRSLKRGGLGCEILVLEAGERLRSEGNIRVIHRPGIVDFTKKPGYQMWKQKYYACLEVETEYGLFIDADTVLVHNNVEDLVAKIGDRFGVTKHWWVPTFRDFYKKCVPEENKRRFKLLIKSLNIGYDNDFFSGGVFIFGNNRQNREILMAVISVYESVYSKDADYIRGITDEVFLSAALYRFGNFTVLSGALNHCVMGDDFMPLKYENNIFYGKNPFEKEWEKITFFHCDTFRRDPSENYKGITRQEIKKAFFLN